MADSFLFRLQKRYRCIFEESDDLWKATTEEEQQQPLFVLLPLQSLQHKGSFCV